MSIYDKLFESKENREWGIIRSGATRINLYSFSRNRDINILSLDTTLEGFIESAVISYDFSKVAYGFSNEQGSFIYTINADGSSKTKVLKIVALGDADSIAWSPDGKKIVFVGKMEKKKESEFDKEIPSTWVPQYNSLYIYNLNTKKIQLLANNGVREISEQCMSVSNDEILYTDTKGNLNIFDIKSNGSRLFIEDASDATWSPSGEWIAYRKDDEDVIAGTYFVTTPDKTKRKKIISKPTFWRKIRLIRDVLGSLIWSPDSRFVYYERDAGLVLDVERPKPFIMEISTGRENRLPKVD